MSKAVQISLLRLHCIQLLRVAIRPLLLHYSTDWTDVDAEAGGISPICAAASKKHRSVVQYLLERGANKGILSNFLPEKLQVFNMSFRCGCRWHDFPFPSPCPVLCLQDSTVIIEAGRCTWAQHHCSPNADSFVPKDLQVDLVD